MSFLHSLFQNQTTIGSASSILSQLMYGSTSQAGIHVSPDSALRTAAVYACVKVLSEDIGKLPLILYRRTTAKGKDSRERASDHPLSRIISVKPNSLQTPMGFRETGTASTALRGNGLSYISRAKGGRVLELIPLHPDRVTIKLDNVGARIYEYQPEKGNTRTLPQSDVLHVMGLSLNGWSGVSPITYAKDTIGLMQATERHGSKVFSNGARMGGILSVPGTFKDPTIRGRIGEEFDATTSGENAHKTLVLEQGMKWEPVTMTNDDAQYLVTRQFQIPEIARFFRMPLHKIGDLTRATFSNIEQQNIDYVVDCLSPWLTRWEQAMNMSLLNEKEQEEYYFEFLVDGLLRGDIASRYTAYNKGIFSGFLTRNECRQRENLNWIEGLDEPLKPLNMVEESQVKDSPVPGDADGK